MVNVTELVLLETERKKHASEMVLERSIRLDSFGLMAGGITHELNQPLNAIRIGADGILLWNKMNKNVLPGIITEMIGGISSSVNRVDEIIRNMKSFINGSINEKLDIFDINAIIRKSVSMFEQKLKNHMISLILDLDPSPINLQADQLRLELVINNLLINAIHALDHGQAKRKNIIISSRLLERKAVVKVEDNGVGLPAGIPKEKLFEPFITTKGEEGSGLGLTIAKIFLEKYGAGIDVETNESGGATFTVYFNTVEPAVV
jgi:C4-dicarboxylate-specific signal transduction histidine kinase